MASECLCKLNWLHHYLTFWYRLRLTSFDFRVNIKVWTNPCVETHTKLKFCRGSFRQLMGCLVSLIRSVTDTSGSLSKYVFHNRSVLQWSGCNPDPKVGSMWFMVLRLFSLSTVDETGVHSWKKDGRKWELPTFVRRMLTLSSTVVSSNIGTVPRYRQSCLYSRPQKKVSSLDSPFLTSPRVFTSSLSWFVQKLHIGKRNSLCHFNLFEDKVVF